MIHRIRKNKITKDEIVADFIFLAVAFIVSIAALFIFDIHWNFYPDGRLFPPEKFIFEDRSIYLWGGLLGSIIGFFIIKLFLFGLKEDSKK
ncbi:MAG: hypothetical protein US31_C0017G0009 [Berkelbacteria bacterium GW2011_GWA1_36_9]|uniref:Uncharacterized protein n=1 Tax=Berkelbacteria bacterium GW2011_GWA1_36_9 TaxID=1618331 RepID=A0A0G0FUW2_9BACT|nr:MAG: hypothetical protein US31_C0017G0009 [Berkelbacteria bacterium GW2011_GWA1_36_9]